MDNGWFIPDEMVGPVSQNTFMEMMNVICTGGQVDVIARKDGKTYNWQCDGLKYATRIEHNSSNRRSGACNIAAIRKAMKVYE